jgi:ATP-dependent helicase/nuclease subunit B
MPEYTQPRLLLGELAALEDALRDQIRAIRQDRPLSPITILIENTMLRDYLRQRLAFSENGHINLKVITVSRFAERFTLEHLTLDRTRMPTYGDRILARNVAESSTGSYFRPVAYSSGFAETLRGLFREFHQAGIEPDDFRSAISHVREDGTEKLADLANLFRRYEQIRRSFYTADDIVGAIKYIDIEDIAKLANSPVFVYGIWKPTGIQRRLFERMMSAGIELRFFLPETGTDADDAHADIRKWLAAYDVQREELDDSIAGESSLDQLHRTLFQEAESQAPMDNRVRLLSAPDAPREVREAARTCLKWAEEGIPFHKMVVVYRHNEPYRTLIDQIFRRAGIVTYLHSGRPLIAEPSGQRLAALLHLIEADMPRSGVMEFITETVLPDTTANHYRHDEKPIQPAVWDGISREAGIVQGRDQWLHRLDLLISSKREFIDPDAEVDEDDPMEAEIREIERLREFILDLSSDLESAKEEATWSEHLQYLQRVANTYIAGLDDLLDQMVSLENLEQISKRVSFERFRETVRHWLQRQNSTVLSSGDEEIPVGRQFGREGVNVFDIGSLRQVRADAVIILGVAERQFPPPPRQDPLLLDRERSQLNATGNWHLPMRSLRAEEETLTFAMAVQAARERLQISFPRSEAGSTRSYLPSHFFRAAASALAGRNIEAGEVDSLDPSLFTRVPAGSFLPPDGTIALDDHEYDRILLEKDPALGLRIVGHYRPGIPRGREADRSRRMTREFTAFDGKIEQELAQHITGAAGRGNRAISPSRLETFATCPFRFFLKYVLRLERVEEPEALERIDPLNRGSLIHEILELFLQDLRSRSERPHPEYRERHVPRLREIASAACERMESTGLVGYPVIWEFDQIAIFEDLEEWYDREAADLADSDLQPETFELRFGWARRKDEGGTGSRDEPYQLPGTPLNFQGRVDRVDLSPDRRSFRVIDYKTGKSGFYRPETFDGGRSLQLPIYLLATSDLLNIPWEHSLAQYFFPTRRGEFQRVSMSGSWLQENHDDLVELLRGMSNAIESGIFPQVPKIGTRDNCLFCDYKELCPVNVKRIADRKKSDDNVLWLRQLIEADPS